VTAVTAAREKTYVLDNLRAIAEWTSYTPTVTQSGAVTKTVTYAKYKSYGGTVEVIVDLAITGTGTGANAVTVSLPVTAASSGTIPVGFGWIFDTTAGTNYKAPVYLVSTTTVAFVGTGGNLGVSEFTAALASGDAVRFTARYEAA
jgi:hypothetical protein